MTAWNAAEVRAAIEPAVATVGRWSGGATVIKPNLNNDLHALTGNSTDLRVLGALLGVLSDLGHREMLVADGPNVGVHRRRIDVFDRLRVRHLARRFGAGVVDLNQDEGRQVNLTTGSVPVARTWFDATVRISAPTIKTHAEAGLSCALKNHVGTVVGQAKRLVHANLAANIAALALAAPPHLVVVDGLVAMEGNGPGDGEPRRLGCVLWSTDALATDLAIAAWLGIPATTAPYLAYAAAARGVRSLEAPPPLGAPVRTPLLAAPRRGRLTRLSERPELGWLKRLVQPAMASPTFARLVHAAGVVQDVYETPDDHVRGVRRTSKDCGACRACADVCPTAVPLAEIGASPPQDACVGCLGCWWVCPKDHIALEGGSLGYLARHQEAWRPRVQRLIDG